MVREVTEKDFRMPEFRDADPKDYEFRQDGKIVRKDRWEQAIREIAGLLDMSRRDFEIDDVVNAVEALVDNIDEWEPVILSSTLMPNEAIEHEYNYPPHMAVTSIKLDDGTVLRNARFDGEAGRWWWRNLTFSPVAWQLQKLDI